MKRILKASLLLIFAATTIAAQKTGNITIRSNVPISASITNRDAPDRAFDWFGPSPLSTNLPIGTYTIRIDLPDGTSSNRTVTIRKDCTTSLDVTYRPPACPAWAPVVTPQPVIPGQPKTEPAPELELKPEPKPTRFDQCCGCNRDNLKARLDLFAIELHQNPYARGRITGPTDKALKYLVNQRGVDHARVELQMSATNCVELWIIP